MSRYKPKLVLYNENVKQKSRRFKRKYFTVPPHSCRPAENLVRGKSLIFNKPCNILRDMQDGLL